MIRTFVPKTTSFSVTVNVPVRELIVTNGLKHKDISTVEDIFIRATSAQTNPVMKKDYDLCRLTLKWAETCNARLESISNVSRDTNRAIKLIFEFSDLTDLIAFCQDFQVNVIP